MSAFRRLIGASKVEKQDDLDAFIDFYNNNNKLYLKALGNLRSPSIRNLPNNEKQNIIICIIHGRLSLNSFTRIAVILSVPATSSVFFAHISSNISSTGHK